MAGRFRTVKIMRRMRALADLPESLMRAVRKYEGPRVPPFSGEPAENLAWNRWRWGSAESWASRDAYGYRWSGGMQQGNDGPATLVGRFLAPHLHGRRRLKIMEIGAGAGRFSAELVRLSSVTHLVDLSPACVDICKERFRYYPTVFCHLNDGRSLDVVADDDFDLIASLDTMIHVAPKIVLGYLDQAVEKLKPGGIIWLDHSGRGEDLTRCRTGLTMRAVADEARVRNLTVEAQYLQGNGDCISVLRKGPRRAPEEVGPDDSFFRSQLRVVDDQLDTSLIGTSAWNESRIPIIRSTFIKVLQNVSLPHAETTQAPILEIGADGQLASAKILTRLTGLEVVASNLTVAGFESKVGDHPITVHQNDIGTLDFPDNSFSMLFGRSVLEHISGLDGFLSECYRVLEPGGVMYLDGGAFYFSPKGHHMAVKGATGTHYGFDVFPDLIPDWFHLQTDEAGLRSYLEQDKGISVEDAQIIAHYIFNSPEQNRLSGSQIIASFQAALFRSVKYDCTFVEEDPPPDLLEEHSPFDLKCHGISFCVTK
jgi:SAM-dependent methyltransferase